MLFANDFGLLDVIERHFCRFRRYFGIEISHLQMAIYTARREEMISVVRSTLRYLSADAPVFVHSLTPLDSPYQVFSFKLCIQILRFELFVLRNCSNNQKFLCCLSEIYVKLISN